MRRAVSLALVFVALAAVGAPPAAASGRAPAVVAAYPNPVAPGDRGEFVVVDPGGSAVVVTDGETTVRVDAPGPVALAAAPDAARNLTDYPVRGVPDLQLANAGETVRLRRDGAVVARMTYEDAPEGELWRSDGWRPLGATDRPVVTTDGGTARTFVLPDDPSVPIDVLRRADRRILLAGYTFTSRRATRALVAAAERGVRVRVLVEGGPVGGLSRREARLLDDLVAAGVEVRVVGGPRARYEFHHAKYAVADDRALVLTENWKPAGTGGRSSRGWGVVLDDAAAARALAATFRADAGWRDGRPWAQFRRGRTFESAPVANGTYPAAFEPRTVPVERTHVVLAPDNAERAVVGLLENATTSVRIVQAAIGGPRQPFLRSALDAAERGVRVRVLLSGAWYAREENRALVAALNERAARRDLPLTARLAEPRGRFEKIHAKGVVVDGDRAVVGSLNWNNHSARENREVAVVLDGEQVAGYYAAVFDADWRRSGGAPVPVALVAAVVLAAAGALALARRLTFDAPGAGPP
ncbi:MAG: phosphatidylserine/phosphatidylglycerophosphate/cardiolipin synthase family protein [Haloarculaceae archaeon]